MPPLIAPPAFSIPHWLQQSHNMPSFHPLPGKQGKRLRTEPAEQGCFSVVTQQELHPPLEPGMQLPPAPAAWSTHGGGSADPFQQLSCGSFLTPASGSKLLSPGLKRRCLSDTEASGRRLASSHVKASLANTSTNHRPSSPRRGANGSLCGVWDPCERDRQLVPLSLLLALCSPVEIGVASSRFLPRFKIASGMFPVDFSGSAC